MQVTHQNGLEANKNESINFSQVWLRYMPYWPLFLLLLILSIGGAWIYLRYTVPLYESTARLMIKDEKKGAEDSKAMESLNLITTKKIIENEIEVIQSRTLFAEVVKSLQLYAPVLQEGRIRSASAYLMSPVKIELYHPDSLKETDKIYFSLNNDSNVVIQGKSYAMNQWVNTAYGTLRFIPNDRYNPDIPHSGKLYFKLVNLKNIAPDMQGRLKVASASKLSTILNLSFRDEVPARGEDILNELLVAYNKAMVSDKNTLAANTLAFVEDRLNHVAADLDTIEYKVQQYRAKRGAVDMSTQGKLFLENVSINDQKLSEVNTQLAVLDKVKEYVLSKNNKGGIVPSTLGINDPVLSQLLNNLYESELQYGRLKKTTAENFPSLLSLSEQIEKIKPGILENLQNQKNGLLAGKNKLLATNNNYTAVLQSIPQKERDLIDINREQNIKNDIYAFLLKKREETALSYASTVSDSRIIDKAQSSVYPVSPKGKMVYMAGAFLSLLLGVGSVVARETLSGKILFRHEIEQITTYPVVGEIAFRKTKNQIVIAEGERTFIAEQFRQLRLTLNFFKENAKKKKILVTSTISGEGKSFVAGNLAMSFALTGRKVILLELDLNRPVLSTIFNVTNEQGISNYLLGNKEPEEIIKRTSAHENLFFISSGPLPNNPAELLLNGRVQELLTYLDTIFDYIILDTAPVTPVTDAYILSSFCDITLYIIRHKYTPKIFIQKLEQTNKIKRLRNIAILFNGISSRGFRKDNYGYRYGYGYVYDDKAYHK
jgi:capsular exopolysaccharide synthesis family protein